MGHQRIASVVVKQFMVLHKVGVSAAFYFVEISRVSLSLSILPSIEKQQKKSHVEFKVDPIMRSLRTSLVQQYDQDLAVLFW